MLEVCIVSYSHNFLLGSEIEVFTMVKIQVEVSCVVTPCSVVVGYDRFGRPCCLHR